MSREMNVYRYNEYIKRIIVLCCIPWAVPIIYFLTRDSNETIKYIYLFFPLVFIAVSVFLLHYSRRVMLGKLIAIDCDWHAAYELDKRPRNTNHNLKILMNMYLFDGLFDKVVECADEILGTSNKTVDVCTAMHQKILALFLNPNNENFYDEILNLINKQRTLIHNHKIKESGRLNSYYLFIEAYASEKYEDSISYIKGLLESKGIEVMNGRKLLVNYLMRLSYVKLNDEKNVKICSDEILLADINKTTYFSKDKRE